MNKIELAPDAFMRQHFTCISKPIKGDPAGQLFSTKMGAHPTYHLYRNEAEALIVNIGAALGIDVEGACNAHDQLVADNAALREQLERRTEAANSSINAALMLPCHCAGPETGVRCVPGCDAALKTPDPVRPQLVEALQSMEMALAGYLHQNDITRRALSKCRAAISAAGVSP